jgi:hypothetical protein
MGLEEHELVRLMPGVWCVAAELRELEEQHAVVRASVSLMSPEACQRRAVRSPRFLDDGGDD